MKGLKIESAVIMGESVGGRTTIEFANKYKNMTAGIVLLHPVVPNEEMV
jgi:pimeloyl-ACP methyl ester carboxylesterase